MDDVVNLFLSYKTVMMAVAVSVLTFFVRRIVETADPSIKKAADENSPQKTYLTIFASWWNQVLLYMIPVLVCMVLVFTVTEFDPNGLTSKGAKFIYSIVVGWASSSVYKVLNKVFKSKTGVDLPGTTDSDPPPPAPPAAN